MPNHNFSMKAGEPLPGEAFVLRLLRQRSSDRVVSPEEFSLSSEDKNEPAPTLSVFETLLTTPSQARALRENPEKVVAYCEMSVGGIRSIRPDPESPIIQNLDVIWQPLTVTLSGIEILDPRPGASGHCGITNLVKPPEVEKRIFKSMRVHLARIATYRAFEELI